MTQIEQLIKDMCPYGVEFKKLGEVLDYEQPTPYLVNDTNYDDSYPTPVLTAGQSFILGYTDEQTGIYKATKETPTIIFDDFTTSFHWVDFDFKVKSSAMKMLRPKKGANIIFRFVYYAMQCIKFQATEHTRYWISKYSQFEIPIPPLEIQKKIVECLDKFSALAAELQAELQMRRKQYEYYRTHLLTPHSGSNSADKSDDRNWVWKTFAELGTFYGGLSGKTKEDFKEGNAKYITYLNIGCNPALRLDILETVNVGPNEKQNTVKYGDALFTGSSETPDECAMSSVLVDQPTENIYLNSFCFGFRFNSLDAIWPAFYKHYFRCEAFRKAVRRTANGTTRFNISKKEFAKLSIPIPSLNEQKRIADILDKFEALTTSLSDGIPAEQAAQQKRYEYYRDLLLTFPRKAV